MLRRRTDRIEAALRLIMLAPLSPPGPGHMS
jgi:hypothetical protein